MTIPFDIDPEIYQISKQNRECHPLTEEVIGYHGTSRKRAESIVKHGFTDSLTLDPTMREGYSSQNYEGGLSFFGNNTEIGKVLATRHAQRVANEEWMKETGNSWANWDDFTDEMKKDMDKDAVLVKIKACPQNYIKDEDVTDEFTKRLKEIATNDPRPQPISSNQKSFNPFFRFTYTRIHDLDQIFEVIDRGVMPSYGIKMRDIMSELGIDAIDGYEKDVSIILNNPNQTIIDMEIIEI